MAAEKKRTQSGLILPGDSSRRDFLRSSAAAAPLILLPSMFLQPGRFAEELLTPPMVEGPFYPNELPLDTDNDLLVINEKITPAVGEITHLHGTVRDQNGNAVRNAVVEIWQCDANGIYMHKDGGPREQLDTNFQGYGRFTTGFSGEYYFRTIKPMPYPGRTPHIHFIVSTSGQRRITTQMLVKGNEMNDRDGLFRRIVQAELRELLLAEFLPVEGSKIGELSAKFDITIGITPDEEQMEERDREERVPEAVPQEDRRLQQLQQPATGGSGQAGGVSGGGE